MKVAVIGGGFSGLAAAEASEADEVVLFDEQGYREERTGEWGEFIHNYSEFPRPRDVEGVNREFEKSHLESFRDGKKLSSSFLTSSDPVTIDRDKFERAWFQEISEGVEYREERIDEEKFLELVQEFDRIIDCSGPWPVSQRATERVKSHSRIRRTLSTTIEADFSDYYPEPAIIVTSNYYSYVNTRSEELATLGVGWDVNEMPEDPYRDFEDLCNLIGIEPPEREELKLGFEPVSGSRPVSECAFEIDGCEIRLAGDAAGLVNPLNRFGNVKSAKSGVAAAEKESNAEYRAYLKDLHGTLPTTGKAGSYILKKSGPGRFARIISRGKEEVRQEDYLEPDTFRKSTAVFLRLAKDMVTYPFRS